jgi:acyl-CoA thioester hydrolase
MYTHTITPRMGDCDGLRHVNNTKLPEWFEQARNPIFRLFSPDLDFAQFDLIMAHLEVDFRHPMAWGQEVEVRTYITRLGTSSFTVSQQAWQGERQCARGHVVIVHYDFSAERSKPLTETQRAWLQQHSIPREEFEA